MIAEVIGIYKIKMDFNKASDKQELGYIVQNVERIAEDAELAVMRHLLENEQSDGVDEDGNQVKLFNYLMPLRRRSAWSGDLRALPPSLFGAANIDDATLYLGKKNAPATLI